MEGVASGCDASRGYFRPSILLSRARCLNGVLIRVAAWREAVDYPHFDKSHLTH